MQIYNFFMKFEDMKMVVIMPKSGSKIETAENKLDYNSLNYIMNSNQKCFVNFQIPRFEMKSSVHLKKVLMEVYIHKSSFFSVKRNICKYGIKINH